MLIWIRELWTSCCGCYETQIVGGGCGGCKSKVVSSGGGQRMRKEDIVGVGGCESVWVYFWCGQLRLTDFFEISGFGVGVGVGVGVDGCDQPVSLKFLGLLLVWNVDSCLQVVFAFFECLIWWICWVSVF